MILQPRGFKLALWMRAILSDEMFSRFLLVSGLGRTFGELVKRSKANL